MKNNSKHLVFYAKKLRLNLTDAEKLLWYYLRSKQFEELKFRRQAPIGPYIVDFVCFSKKLIIELDGSQHIENENKVKDQKRDAWLKGRGFRILRFWNNDILQNINSVLENILECINTLP